MTTKVEVKGLRELRAALMELPVRVQAKAVYASLNAGAAPMRDEAKNRVPVLQESVPHRRPGTLKRAIRVSRSRINRGKDGLTEVILRVKPLKVRQIGAFKASQAAAGHTPNSAQNPDDPFYWRFVEFGTSKMPARPFLRPAFEVHKNRAVELIKARLAKGIDQAARMVRRGARG